MIYYGMNLTVIELPINYVHGGKCVSGRIQALAYFHNACVRIKKQQSGKNKEGAKLKPSAEKSFNFNCGI